MKITELIDKFQEIKNIHGDLICATEGIDGLEEIEGFSLTKEKIFADNPYDKVLII